MNILAHLEKKVEVWFLLLISFLFFLLRLPSLFEPYWYGDEGIYQAIADAMRSGRLLYSQIWDNKPPLLYLIYAIYHGDQFSLRLVSLIFGLCSVVVFFFLARKLFTNPKAIMLATGVFALLFALPVIEGNIANAENFLLLPIVLAFLFLLKCIHSAELHVRRETDELFTPQVSRKLFFPGLLLGLAFLLKIVGLFDTVAFFVIIFLLLLPGRLSLATIVKHVVLFFNKILLGIIGFLTPLALTCLYFLYKGAFSDFLHAAFLGNVNYVGYNNSFVIPQGLLVLKLLLLALALVVLLLFRRKLPAALLVILTWLSFSVFSVFFAQRPYPHYLLVLLPAFCLLLGSIVEYKKSRLPLSLLALGVLFAINMVFHVFSYRPPFSYYLNFVLFVTGKKDTSSYQAFFDRNVNKNYMIADYLKLHTNPEDIVFIWGNSAQIYHLSHTLPPGKYVVAYHITSKPAIADTEIDINKTRPRYIVLQSDVSAYPFSLDGYLYKATIQDTTIYEKSY